MNVNKVLTKDYENKSNWTLGENEPKTNPKRTQSNPILSAVGGLQMNVNLYNTRDYENKWQRTLGENEPKTNPIQSQSCPP